MVESSWQHEALGRILQRLQRSPYHCLWRHQPSPWAPWLPHCSGRTVGSIGSAHGIWHPSFVHTSYLGPRALAEWGFVTLRRWPDQEPKSINNSCRYQAGSSTWFWLSGQRTASCRLDSHKRPSFVGSHVVGVKHPTGWRVVVCHTSQHGASLTNM
jgi:hypothetical protein